MYAFTNRGWLITGEVDPAWAKVLNESPFDSTKASVAVALGRQHAVSMLSRCYSNSSEDEFEFAYNMTKNFLSYVKPGLIETEQGEKDSAGAFVRKMFRGEIEGKMNNMEEYVKKPTPKGSPEIDQARYLKAAKLLNRYIGD